MIWILFALNPGFSNAWMALTNLAFAIPCYRAWKSGHEVDAGVLLAAALSSAAYHLVENQKHNMPGLTRFATPTWNQCLLNLDRVCAVMAVWTVLQRSVYLSGPRVWFIGSRSALCVGIVALVCMALSETWFRHNHRSAYLVLHTVWHWGAAYVTADVYSR